MPDRSTDAAVINRHTGWHKPLHRRMAVLRMNNRRVPIDDAPYAFGVDGDHVSYQPEELVDDRAEDAAEENERLAQAEAFFWAVLSFPGLSDQQRLVGLAKYFLLRYGEDAGTKATARFLNWDPVTGPPKVAEQWKRLTVRLNKDSSIGSEWHVATSGDDPAAA